MMADVQHRVKRRGTAREAAERVGASIRTAQRWTSIPREEWITQKAVEREEIRAYKYDEGHTWGETSRHFGIAKTTAQERARRARRERAAEAEKAAEEAEAALRPTLFEGQEQGSA
ncbi:MULTISPECIES: hypothetical protein [Acidipropionibacterium]|jgi:transposase|nr:MULTISPECIES: hypothetical protein [Acidipropionibacterium]MDN5997546.1 hypothetical protein [Acidipropionibacterium jensenii]MDN6812616.1 hypothetical protein [Acidipropionibacterium jensenii]